MMPAMVPTKKVPFTIDNILSNDGQVGRTSETFSDKVPENYPIKSTYTPSSLPPSPHHFSGTNFPPTFHPHYHQMSQLLHTHQYQHLQSNVFKGPGDDHMISDRLHASRSIVNGASPSDMHLKSVMRSTLPRNPELEMNANGSMAATGNDLYSLQLYPNQQRNCSHQQHCPHQQDSSLSLSPCPSQSPSMSVHQVHPSVLGISGPPGSGVTFSWVSPPKCLPRKRTVFSRYQRNELERKFEAQKYISKTERLKFARELGLKDSQVKVWFINRRTKWRNDREKRVRRQHQVQQV